MTQVQFQFLKCSYTQDSASFSFNALCQSTEPVGEIQIGTARNKLRQCAFKSHASSNSYELSGTLTIPSPSVEVYALNLVYLITFESGIQNAGALLIEATHHPEFFYTLNQTVQSHSSTLGNTHTSDSRIVKEACSDTCSNLKKELSVCVYFSGSEQTLQSCTQSVRALFGQDVEFLVYYPQNSTDIRTLEERFDDIRWVGLPDEKSCQLLGRNACVERASHKAILFIDDSMQLEASPDLSQLVERVASNPMAVSGAILKRDGSVRHAGGILWQHADPTYFTAPSFDYDPLLSTERLIHFCGGGLLLINKAALIKSGLFDESLDTRTAQDVAIAYQLAALDIRAIYSPFLHVSSSLHCLDHQIFGSDREKLAALYRNQHRHWADPFVHSPRQACQLHWSRAPTLELMMYPEAHKVPVFTRTSDQLCLHVGKHVDSVLQFLSVEAKHYDSVVTESLAWLRLAKSSQSEIPKIIYNCRGHFYTFQELVSKLHDEHEITFVAPDANSTPLFSKQSFYYEDGAILTASQFYEFSSSATKINFLHSPGATVPSVGEVSSSPLDSCTTTILVPIFNSWKLVQKCLQSIQQFGGQQFHLVLVNDCSTEFSSSELETLVTETGFSSYTIIHKSSNTGFTSSVNIGLLFSYGNVLLLNSDAELKKNTLSEILFHLVSNSRIASVTPFSNDDSLCGLPVATWAPQNFSFHENDLIRVLQECKDDTPLTLPSGIGYCMLLSENALQACGLFDANTFGRGYGEENDWSQRAIQFGFSNILADTAYVSHVGHQSFRQDTRTNQFKLGLVQSLHAQYADSVQALIASQHLQNKAADIQFALSKSVSDVDAVMYIDTMGASGGAHQYLLEQIEKVRDQKRVYAFLLSDDGYYFADFNWDEAPVRRLPQGTNCKTLIQEIVENYGITELFVNSLVSSKKSEVLSALLESSIPYHLFLHDYFLACPSVHLRNDQGNYCNAETNVDTCELCIQSVLSRRERIQLQSVYHGMESWRESSLRLLAHASSIATPSHTSKNVLSQYFPTIAMEVTAHPAPHYCYESFEESFAYEKPLRVGVLGSTSHDKGAELLYELAAIFEAQALPLQFHVIGSTAFHHQPTTLYADHLQIHGAYEKESVSSLLHTHRCGLVLFPYLIPETYSYTTDEAIYSGYPLLVSDIGAPPERVLGLEAGWTFPTGDTAQLLKFLLWLEAERKELLKKAMKGQLRQVA